MELLKLCALLLLLVAPASVCGDFRYDNSVKECAETLFNIVEAVGNKTACDYILDYSKCFLRVTNAITMGLDDADLQEASTAQEESLKLKGVVCKVDYVTAMREFKAELSTDAFKDAKIQENCDDTVSALTTAKGEDKLCEYIKGYFKCTFRVQHLLRQDFTSAELKQVGDDLKAELAGNGKNCDVDYQAVVNELRSEIHEGNFKDAKSMADCYHTLENIHAVHGTDKACETVTGYLTCFITQTTDVSLDFNEDEVKVAGEQMAADLKGESINCDVDLNAIVQEVKKSRNGAALGQTSLPVMWLSLAAILVLRFVDRIVQ